MLKTIDNCNNYYLILIITFEDRQSFDIIKYPGSTLFKRQAHKQWNPREYGYLGI